MEGKEKTEKAHKNLFSFYSIIKIGLKSDYFASITFAFGSVTS